MTGVGAVGPENTGCRYNPHSGMGCLVPNRIGQLPESGQVRGVTLHERLLRGAQDIAERERIKPPHATFEARGLVAIMHGAAETGELPVCDWYDGRIRSILY